jgi:prolipoprotein diacylglyceryltransferase
LLCLIYGTGISLLILIPNSWRGRLGMAFCSGIILGIGATLYFLSRAAKRKPSVLPKRPSLELVEKP